MGKKREHGNECWVSMPAGKMLRIGLSESDFFTISLKNFKQFYIIIGLEKDGSNPWGGANLQLREEKVKEWGAKRA